MAADPCSRAGCDRLLAFRRLRRSAEDIIEIGRDLLSVKASLPHGSFLPWIEAEFGMHQTTANRFMHVATHYGSKVSTVLNLDPSALYELAAPKTPPEVREEVERLIAAGEVVSKATVDDLRRRAEVAEAGQSAAVRVVSKKPARHCEVAPKLREPHLKEAVASEVREHFGSCSVAGEQLLGIGRIPSRELVQIDDPPLDVFE